MGIALFAAVVAGIFTIGAMLHTGRPFSAIAVALVIYFAACYV